MLFRFRSEGRHYLPTDGGGLILSTHQSNFDPVLVGLTSPRRLNYLARKTLFRSKIFGTLIRFLDAIEIDREGGGLQGLRETISRLKHGELVLIFPEGTRTVNGEIGELKTGFLAIARRSAVPLIPCAITGAFEVLPRGTKLPAFRPIAVVYGPPIRSEEFLDRSDDELLAMVRDRLYACADRAKKLL